MNTYNKVKIVIYSLTIVLSITLSIIFGIRDGHTPPLGFVSSLIFGVIGICWLIVDWILNVINHDTEFTLKPHLIGMGLNFLIVILIYLI